MAAYARKAPRIRCMQLFMRACLISRHPLILFAPSASIDQENGNTYSAGNFSRHRPPAYAVSQPASAKNHQIVVGVDRPVDEGADQPVFGDEMCGRSRVIDDRKRVVETPCRDCPQFFPCSRYPQERKWTPWECWKVPERLVTG